MAGEEERRRTLSAAMLVKTAASEEVSKATVKVNMSVKEKKPTHSSGQDLFRKGMPSFADEFQHSMKYYRID